MTYLRELNLSFCHKITCDSLQFLTTLKFLSKLNLSGVTSVEPEVRKGKRPKILINTAGEESIFVSFRFLADLGLLTNWSGPISDNLQDAMPNTNIRL